MLQEQQLGHLGGGKSQWLKHASKSWYTVELHTDEPGSYKADAANYCTTSLAFDDWRRILVLDDNKLA